MHFQSNRMKKSGGGGPVPPQAPPPKNDAYGLNRHIISVALVSGIAASMIRLYYDINIITGVVFLMVLSLQLHNRWMTVHIHTNCIIIIIIIQGLSCIYEDSDIIIFCM